MSLQTYFKKLYQRTMQESYGWAIDSICTALALDTPAGRVLDCGAGGVIVKSGVRHDQAAFLLSSVLLLTSTPSLNLTPSMTLAR